MEKRDAESRIVDARWDLMKDQLDDIEANIERCRKHLRWLNGRALVAINQTVEDAEIDRSGLDMILDSIEEGVPPK